MHTNASYCRNRVLLFTSSSRGGKPVGNWRFHSKSTNTIIDHPRKILVSRNTNTFEDLSLDLFLMDCSCCFILLQIFAPVSISSFLPRCMECRRGLAMRILSVCLSVRLSNAWIVTKWNKNLSRFFLSYEKSFSLVFEKKNGWWMATLLPEILGQPAPVGAKSQIFNAYSLVAPQP